ncbi:TetR/AcrR family transcriptional regulator [Devosia aurantiaca]|uniref:TetR/AcrR family transcriptional regulator n=1 Tax=Devosia aurantiaca TaxID=2714858 RepID=A0A6M1SPS3_9HYPH|nr:TetR/AcrR family transcriptional regulator [Devosia aurantiaca]NGP16473.1 TetR/AcrR family transcriptional regulator [Devosia aurantiaca]
MSEAILFAAILTFVEKGYDNASMDDVAARASTTKRTVYSHFGSKDALFRSALVKAVELFQSEMPKLADPSDPARELEAFAMGFSDLSTWRGAVQLQRVVMGGAERFADLGKMLHEQIIEHAEAMLADYFEAVATLNARNISQTRENYWELASIFLNMTTGPQRFATLLEHRQPSAVHPHVGGPSDTDRPAIQRAIAIFLAGTSLAAPIADNRP